MLQNARLMELQLMDQLKTAPTWSDRWWTLLKRLDKVRTDFLEAGRRLDPENGPPCIPTS